MKKTQRLKATNSPVDFPAVLSGIYRIAREMGLDIHNADHLKTGSITWGPCIVEQHSATIVVPPGGYIEISEQGDFMVTLDD